MYIQSRSAVRRYPYPMSAVRGVRGATQVGENSPASIAAGTVELLGELLAQNQLTPQDLISVIFTVSPDLDAAFPATAARSLGFEEVPLLCAVEIGVPGSLERTIRILMHVNTSKSSKEISHVYLHGAKSLRSDIAQ